MTLLQAIKIIKNKINFKMIIIGKGINKNKILNFIKENNLSKKVKVLPFKENPLKYIKLSNVFILTSTFEGLPNVLLEAICLKKFIISSKCPTGPREILNSGKGGFLFDVGNYRELAKKIEEYYFNQNFYKKKIDYAYKNLYRFNYDDNLKKYLNVVLNHS
jgi:glycosyltransferase involved in cell wall biosynthesis